MKRLLALAAALAVTSAPAAAQDVWGWSIIIPSVARTDILGQELSRRMAQPPSTPAAQAPAAATSLTYKPSAERRAANFKRFVDQRRAADPATARELQALLAQPDLMAQIGQEMRKRGLRPDNLADAFAIWWVQTWQTAHGQVDDPSPAAMAAVKAQAQAAFLASPSLLSASDGDKQEMAEGMLIQAAILGTALEQVKSNPAQVRALGQMARQTAGQVGLDLDAMTLTDKGFSRGAG